MLRPRLTSLLALVALTVPPALAQEAGDRARELNQRHEWATFVTEVDNQLVNVRAQLSAALARLRDRDLPGALRDLADAEQLLGELPALAKDYTRYHTLEETQRHLESRRAEVAALRRELGYLRGYAYLQAGELPKAREACEAGLAQVERAEEGIALRLLSAAIQTQAGQTAEAVRALEALRDEFPDRPEVRFRLGQAHEAAGAVDAALACYDWVIERLPKVAAPRLSRGTLLLRTGRAAEALECFERAVELDGNGFDAYLWRGNAKAALGRYAEAREDLTEAIDLTPSRPEGYFHRAEAAFSDPASDVASVIKDCEVAISRQRDFHPAHLLLARAHERDLDYDRAEAQYEQLLQTQGVEPKLAREATLALGELKLVRADRWLCSLEGDEALRAPRLEAAMDACRAVIRAAPQDVAPWLLAARILMVQERWPDAVKQLRRAAAVLAEQVPAAELAAAPRHGEIQALLGAALLLAGDASGAEQAIGAAEDDARVASIVHAVRSGLALQRNATSRARDSVTAARGAQEQDLAAGYRAEATRSAELARRSGKPEYARRAARAFARVVLLQPLDGWAWLEWARLCGERSKLATARGLAAESARRLPALAESHETLGFLLLQRAAGAAADAAAAIPAFDRAIELAEREASLAAHAHYGRAQALLLRAGGPTPAARADLQAAARAAPGADARDPQALARGQLWLGALAELEAALGEPAEAERLRRATSALRDRTRDLSRQALAEGRVARDRLDYSLAIKTFDRAIELDPTFAEAIYDRGTCSLKVGNFVPGILDFSRALELDPAIGDTVYDKLFQISHVVDLNRVIEELDKIVSDYPGTSYVVFLRGFFYVAKLGLAQPTPEDVTAGIADFERTLELNPDHVTALIYRGLLRCKQAELSPAERDRSYASAEADFARGIELHPTSRSAYYLRALMHSVRSTEAGLPDAEAAARRGRAIDDLRRAVANGWDRFDRLRKEPGFEALGQEPAFQQLLRGR